MGDKFVFGGVVISIAMALFCSDGQMAMAATKEPAKMSVTFEEVSGVKAGAKNSYAAYHSPAKLFDKDLGTMWHSATNDFGWVSVSYKKPFKASSYKITRRADISSQAPVGFVLEGAVTEKFPDNESKWKILDAQKNQKWTDVLTQTYKIKQPDSFIHYRLRILATEGKFHASIAEWELVK